MTRPYRIIVFLCPGIGRRDKKGETGIGALRPGLEKRGWTVVYLPLGSSWIGYFLFRVRLANKPVAVVIAAVSKLLHFLGYTVVFVGHSNGAQIGLDASQLGAYFRVMVWINGAASRKPVLGPNTGWLMNYFNRSDWVLSLGQFLKPWDDVGRKDVSKKANIKGLRWGSFDTRQWGVGGFDTHSEVFEIAAEPLAQSIVDSVELAIETNGLLNPKP